MNVILGVVICVNDGVSLQKAVTTSSSAINETIYIEFCGVNTIDLTGTGDSYGTDIVALNKVIDIQCSKQFKKCTFINGTFSVRESIIRIHNIDFNNTQFRSEYNSQINISSSTFRNTNNDQVVNAFDSSISLHDVIFENNKLIQRVSLLFIFIYIFFCSCCENSTLMTNDFFIPHECKKKTYLLNYSLFIQQQINRLMV